MAKTVLLLFAVHCSLFTASAQPRIDYTRWVNPFIGTGGHGHTFPGATMPFGMVQLSPDTRTDNWDGSSGYHYSDDIIYGFSHTHLSGTGIPDYCDILFMPTAGKSRYVEKLGDKTVGVFGSKFSHDNEKAEPGYYSVRLDDDGILAELTATNRVGLHRYTFPNAGQVQIQLNMTWRDKPLDIQVTHVDDRRIEGYRSSSSWAKDQIVYFVAEFSKPYRFNKYSKWLDHDVTLIPGSIKTVAYSTAFEFTATAGEQIQLKVALSPVSIEGARKNLAAEVPGWNFDKVRADAKAAWNRELSKIEVTGGTEAQRTTFYTALYHTMIQPNIFEDVDGSYRGHDGKTHNIRDDALSPGLSRPDAGKKPPKGGTQSPSHEYTVFSLWDTFRAAHPLYTIIDQKRTVDFINTFIRQYEQGGRLPVWELAGNETDCMIGYHAVSVIADAMAKGIKGFDYEKAYEAAKHSAELNHFGLDAYKRRGYISMEDENESVSKTLEYAYDDWCIAQMAAIVAKKRNEDYAKHTNLLTSLDRDRMAEIQFDKSAFIARARYFENLFDPKTTFFRPKKNGGFVEPFAPNEVTFGFTEGNSWQYSFFVPQDVSRLMELMGGREKFIAKLDELFTTSQKLGGREQADLTGLIGQYAHGNEPSHHIAYLYDYAGEPWKTQKYVRQILDDFYKPTPDGLIGNEDCGQMSAWYIISASGVYEVAPGNGIYSFGTPLFPEVKFHLENGKTFTIRANNASPKNIYIKTARLDGKPYSKSFITHEDIMRGSLLEFDMTDQPVTTAFTAFPVSAVKYDSVAVPVITGERTFANATTITMSTLTPNAAIAFTTNGRDPYPDEPGKSTQTNKGPFVVDRSVTIRAVAIGPLDQISLPAEAVFTRRPNDWAVKVTSGYSRQYTGGGDNAIVDGIRGTTNFASGEWQGVQGRPYEAIVDLQRTTDIREVGASFLQVASPWIWMPDRIEFEISDDGTNYIKVAEIKPGFPQREMTPTIKEYREAITPTKARYLRIRAFNIGKIPDWHPGAGSNPWIFIDEIFIQ